MNNLLHSVSRSLKRHSAPLRKQQEPLAEDLSDFAFRPLSADDAIAYKTIRTMALTGKDARYFTADPQKEFSRSLDDWREVCTEKQDRAIIGAFKEEDLVGVWSVMRSESDTTGKTVYYSAVYVHPEFRHIDITKKLIWMWKTWAIFHGYDKAIFTIRTDNPWLKEHMRRGAIIKKEYEASFADGSIAPLCLVEHPICSAQEYQAMKLEAELHWLLKLDNGDHIATENRASLKGA